MGILEEKLEAFLDDIKEMLGTDIISLIGSSKLRLITEKYQSRIDFKEATICSALMMRQKRRNDAFVFSITELLRECEKKKLNPIFFKGIFLAADLYEKIERRIANDIDIIISVEAFREYNDILEGLGYAHEFFCEENDYYGYYLEEVKQKHLGYIKEVGNEIVHVEVHTTVINPASLFDNTTAEFIENAFKKELLGLCPYVLGTEYNLIALSMHFFKHLPLTYFQNLLFNRPFNINMCNIHDIALLVNKYQNDIEWGKVLDIARRMNVIKYLLFVATFVNNIYGELFETNFLKRLSENAGFSRLSSVNSEGGGLGKVLWLFDIYINYCINYSPVKILLGELAKDFNLINIGSDANSQFYSVRKGEKRRIEKTFCFYLENNNGRNVEINMLIDFSDADFSIKYHVNNKNCSPLYSEDEECYKKDGIEIVVIKEKSIVHRMLTVKEEKGSYSLIVYSHNNKKIEKPNVTEITYNLDVQKNNFDISVHMPWAYLDIDCKKDKRILFNVAGLVSGSLSHTQEKACNIFRSDKTIWDFRGINGIEFIE